MTANEDGARAKTVLCYGDSNTWGFRPDRPGFRYGREIRWTGRLQGMLGQEYRIIEEGLNGRTTVFPDHASPGRVGLDMLIPCIQSHEPLDLIILMLGTNDTKVKFNAPPEEIGRGMRALVKAAKNPYTYECGEPPPILLVSPILVAETLVNSWLQGVFSMESAERSRWLAKEYRAIAEELGCYFFDASSVAGASPRDGIHLNEAGHAVLAEAMVLRVREILG